MMLAMKRHAGRAARKAIAAAIFGGRIGNGDAAAGRRIFLAMG